MAKKKIRNTAEGYINKIRVPHERTHTRDPGPETQGGYYHGPPKRWTGRGPTPARHIPWPEVFRHHISNCEGHLRMMQMVQKHIEENTRNWDLICKIIENTEQMVFESKRTAKDFIIPRGQRQQVPLNCSSASMYPGYSPADHNWGDAAAEYGQTQAEMKKQGIDVPVSDDVYKVGQSRGIKKRTLAQIRAASDQEKAKAGSASKPGSGSNNAATKPINGISTANSIPIANGTKGSADASYNANDVEKGEDGMPLFIIDSNPMKVDIPGMKPPKRSSTPSDSVQTKKHKKAKTKTAEDTLADAAEHDISAEVDTKLKEKAEKKTREKNKKRKRESGDAEPAKSSATLADIEKTDGDEVKLDEKPEKKKRKSAAEKTKEKKRKRKSGDTDVVAPIGEELPAEEAGDDTKPEKPKKKKLKSSDSKGKGKKRKSEAENVEPPSATAHVKPVASAENTKEPENTQLPTIDKPAPARESPIVGDLQESLAEGKVGASVEGAEEGEKESKRRKTSSE
ncbi:uncharacterized protein KY384_004744 [Bacidia gigantensis]|uniref:uncharacterized protein n=1 Tax=Bacidia gigantensis TaxID=2732470 RepID=UPI001D04E336|nr:uncharacterized protein KY384_004744 [Bacidia gigantensis]KAG8530244.1 hypothetical protein KY384_004744 [Bacidia gigantensis]